MESKLTARVTTVGVKQASNDLDKFTKSSDSSEASTVKLTSATDILDQKLKVTNKAVKEATKALDDLKKSSDGSERSQKRISAAQVKLQKATIAQAEATKRLANSTKKAESGFTKFGRSASAAVGAINGPLGGISGRLSSLVTLLSNGGAVIAGVAASVTALGFVAAKGASNLDELNVSLARSNALLEATGFAAGVTAEQLEQEARAIALNTLASTEGIRQAQSILLTFNKVQGEAREQAVSLSQDLASVFGGTARSQATALGKALQDPIRGITALNRVGVTFSETQKEQIRNFVEAGETAEAQGIILQNLSSQVGGAAAAVASATLAGALDTAGQLASEVSIELAKQSGIYDGILASVNSINDAFINIKGSLEATPLDEFNGNLDQANAEVERLDRLIESVRQKTQGQFGGELVFDVTTAEDVERRDEIKAAIDAQQEILKARQEAERKGAEEAKRIRDQELADIEKKESEKQAKILKKEQERAQKQLEIIEALNDSELEAINRKEQQRLANIRAFRDQELIADEEFQSAKAEIELAASEKRKELRAEEAAQERELREEQNRILLEANEQLSGELSSNIFSLIRQQKSLKDAAIDTISSITDSIVQSFIKQQVQQKITDRIASTAFVKSKSAEVATSVQQAGLNAFTATSGAPYPINLSAPAAAAAASATAAGIGSGVVSSAAAREQGGNLSIGQTSSVAERGNLEFLVPSSSSRVRTAQQMRQVMNESQPSPQVTVFVIDQSTGAKTFDEDTDADGNIVITIRDIVSSDINDPNSEISKSLASNINAERSI